MKNTEGNIYSVSVGLTSAHPELTNGLFPIRERFHDLARKARQGENSGAKEEIKERWKPVNLTGIRKGAITGRRTARHS